MVNQTHPYKYTLHWGPYLRSSGGSYGLVPPLQNTEYVLMPLSFSHASQIIIIYLKLANATSQLYQ